MDADTYATAALQRILSAAAASDSGRDDVHRTFTTMLAREIDAHAARPDEQALLLSEVDMLSSTAPASRTHGMAAERTVADAALRALRANATHGPCVAAAFGALETLAPALAAHTVVAAAVIRAAVDALRGSGEFSAHAASAEVSEAASGALQMLLVESEDATKRAAAEAGALAALLAAMQRFPAAAALQYSACFTLSSLFNSSSAPQLQADDDASKAIGAVMAALRTYADEASLVKDVAMALGGIIRNSAALQTAALGADALNALLAAMRRHGGDAGVVTFICFALTSLDFCSPTVAPSDADAMVDVTMAALRAHPSEANAQGQALRALGRACLQPHAAARASAAGAAGAALRAMRDHRAEPAVQGGGCEVFAALEELERSSKPAAARAGALGAVGAVVDVLRAGPETMLRIDELQTLQTLAVVTLLELISGDKCNSLRALHAGALSVLDTPRMRAAMDQCRNAHAALVEALTAVAAEHVRSAAGRRCSACAALRERGAMCGAAGCGACARPGGGGRLLMCARCRRAAYCCKEHQQAAWRASHKAECVLRDGADDGAGQ